MADNAPQSKRPADSKFKQQKLPAWKPVLTPRTVLPTFLAIGVIFIAVGAALLVASNSVKEFEVDYTDCVQIDSPGTGQKCADLLEDQDNGFTNTSDPSIRCRCQLNVTLEQGFGTSQVYVYYKLTNYFQNHRRYVKSRWDPQLRSEVGGADAECSPLSSIADGRYYAPCGLVANSLFNDTIQMKQCTGATTCDTTVPLTGRHITWPSDRNTKFQNPSFTGDLCDADVFSDTVSVKPPNWIVKACELGLDTGSAYNPWSPKFNSSGRGYENEDLIVWMRTAALPSFRKLWRKVLDFDLADGTYLIDIDYNYPAKNFDGKKKIVLATTSWLGGENPFLGICYLVVGCLCLAIVVVFMLFMKFGKNHRQLGDITYLRWDRE